MNTHSLFKYKKRTKKIEIKGSQVATAESIILNSKLSEEHIEYDTICINFKNM